MKIWVDDIRPVPVQNRQDELYVWCKSVNETKRAIIELTLTNEKVVSLIDLDHDAGSYATDGGDYIRILDWLEETGRSYPIRIHSANPVGVANMRRIIKRNGWTEVK